MSDEALSRAPRGATEGFLTSFTNSIAKGFSVSHSSLDIVDARDAVKRCFLSAYVHLKKFD